MKQDILSTGEAARVLGVPPWKVGHLFDCHKLPEPQRVGGQRVIDRKLLKKIAEMLNLEMPKDEPSPQS